MYFATVFPLLPSLRTSIAMELMFILVTVFYFSFATIVSFTCAFCLTPHLFCTVIIV